MVVYHRDEINGNYYTENVRKRFRQISILNQRYTRSIPSWYYLLDVISDFIPPIRAMISSSVVPVPSRGSRISASISGK